MRTSYGLWWRAYVDLLNDPKVQQLDGDLFKFWVNLLCVAAIHRGRLPSIPDIAFHMRHSAEYVVSECKKLVASHLIDRDGDTYIPHNWAGRQYVTDGVTVDRTGARRAKAYRDRKRAASRAASHDGERDANVTVTPLDRVRDRDRQKVPAGAGTAPPSPKPVTPKRIRSGRRGAGTRIPEDFVPDGKAALKIGLPFDRLAVEAAKFTDYFRAAPDNRGGLKVDWQATWRSWCRRAINPEGDPQNGKQKAGNGSAPRPSRDPNAAILRALADVAAESLGVPGRAPDPDEGIPGDAGAGEGDPAQAVDLGPGDYRRAH